MPKNGYGKLNFNWRQWKRKGVLKLFNRLYNEKNLPK